MVVGSQFWGNTHHHGIKRSSTVDLVEGASAMEHPASLAGEFSVLVA